MIRRSFPHVGIAMPISLRLTLWYGMSLLVLLGLFSVVIYTAFDVSLHRDFDRHLQHERQQLLPYISIDAEKPVFRDLTELHSVAYHTQGIYGTYVRLLDPDGRVIFRSPNLEGQAGPAVNLPRHEKARTRSWMWDQQVARTLTTPLYDRDSTLAGWLEVTGFEWSVQRELDSMERSLWAGIFICLVLAVGGGFLLSRRALRPVARLTDAAHRIRATDLSARLPVEGTIRDELTRLAETFNGMLERLDASFQRERRFTSNAAHELLTPLATLKNELEITLRRPRTPEEYASRYADMLVEVDEMTAMVRSLLQLSRLDTGEAEREPVDFGEVVGFVCGRLQDRIRERNQVLTVDAPQGIFVSAAQVRLAEAVHNLIDNAVKYTPAGGKIFVTLRPEHDRVVFTVTDTGYGFEPELADRLFDRFYRSDAVGVQAEPGSGLGLAIVRAVTELDGGTVRAVSAGPGQGATFTIVLPRIYPS